MSVIRHQGKRWTRAAWRADDQNESCHHGRIVSESVRSLGSCHEFLDRMKTIPL